jgi:hypothetical protein
MLLEMVESILVGLLLVLAIILITNPIQAKPIEHQRISSNASTFTMVIYVLDLLVNH